jgi:NAD(P)-dependent dehydrogenase (short-subunit alcohol dehydrogenase family)
VNDRVAIVTGGGRGIGLAIAEQLAAAGFRLCITGRSAERLEQARAALAELTDVVAVTGDVAVEGDVLRTVTAAERLGPVTAVVNNAAARGPTKPMHEYTTAEFAETLNVNVLGPFLVIKHAVVPMLERRAGSIVNIGSIAGVEAYPLRSAYCTSKWGLVGLTRTLAKEYGPDGVRVNLVAPGPTEGEGADGVIGTRAAAIGKTFDELKSSLAEEIPLRRFVTADETAAAVRFLVSDAASGITGQSFCVSGGIEV